ncbi:hypothetical protein [Bacillus dakarensis]|nr:hypothetical protein [Bacillus dakarensis]
MDKTTIFIDILKESYEKGEQQDDLTVKEIIEDMTERLRICIPEYK